MSDELKPCPECGNEYLAIRTDIYKNARGFVYCDCCGCMADKAVWNRISPVSAPMGANGEAIPLPPLPKAADTLIPQRTPAFAEWQMRDYAREAIAPYAERIRHLERELEQARAAFIGSENARKDAERARGTVQSIDTEEFQELLAEWFNNDDAEQAYSCAQYRRLITYIDGRTAGTAPAPLMRQAVASVVSRVGDEFRVGWLRPERCEVGTLLYVAAPTPLNGKEEA